MHERLTAALILFSLGLLTAGLLAGLILRVLFGADGP